MELRQLRYLIAVAHHGSFTRAAVELHVAQSALSEQVRRLDASSESNCSSATAAACIPLRRARRSWGAAGESWQKSTR